MKRLLTQKAVSGLSLAGVLTLVLCGFVSSSCKAQFLERCDAKHLHEERFSLPHLSAEGRSASAQLISQLLTKASWSKQSLGSGILVQGTLTIPGGAVRPITFYFQGDRRVRIEVTEPTGLRIVVVDGNKALSQVGGQIKALPVDSILTEATYLPFYSDITAPMTQLMLTAPNTSSVEGVQATNVRSFHYSRQPSQSAQNPENLMSTAPHRMNGRTTESEFLLDPATLLPLEIKSCSPLLDNPNASRMVDRRFTSYTTSQGITYPAHIDQVVGGTRHYVLNITSFQANQTFSDSLWTLGSSSPGGAQ